MTATRSWIGDWVVLLSVLLALSLGVIAVGGMAGTAPVGNDPVPAGSVITENESNDATTLPVRLNGTLGSEYDSVTHFEVSSLADAVVVLNGSTRLEAYDASGDRMWTTALAGSVDTTPTVSDGVVYVTMVNQSDADLEDGDLRAYDASDGTLRWSARGQLDDGTDIEIDDDTAPVVGEHVYAHRRGGSESYDNVEIHALNRDDGSLVWSEEVSEDARSVTFTAASGTVYIGEGDGVRALNASTRELEWDRSSRLLGSAVAADPVVHDDTLYVAESSGDTHAVYALNTSDGGARWRTPVNDEIDHSPVVVDGVPVVASGQSLHALDPSTGEGTGEALTGGTILDIAHDGGELLVASEDGHLRSMNADLALNWRYDLPSPREEPGEVAWPIAVGSTGETTFVHGGIGGQLGETQPDEAIYRLEPTSIAVTDVSVSDAVARPGDVVTAEANVSNEGGDTGEFEVTFEVEGPFTAAGPKTYTESIALGAGEESTVTTTFEIRSTGEYAVTALESGTDGTTDPRPAPATVDVTRAIPDHDWNQVDFDARGSDWNPDAHAPAGTLEPEWEHQTGTGADHNIGTNRILVDNGSVVVHNETTLRTLDLQTGALEWEFRPDAKTESNLSDPADVDERITSTAIADGVVYVLMDYCKEQFCDTGDHASRLYALDMDSGTSVWAEYVNHSGHRATEELTVAGGSVLFQLYDADPGVRKYRLYEVGTATGQERNSRNISSEDFQDDFIDLSASQLRATDERVFFVQNSSVHTLNRGSLDRVDNRSFGTYGLEVASDGETIYVADRYHPDDTNVSERRNGTVYALNSNDLQDTYWTTTVDRVRESDDVAGTERILDLAVTDERVYISSDIGFSYDGGDGIYALDADTGDVIWLQEGLGDRSVTVADGVVYAQAEDWMYSLDASTGGVSAKTGTPSYASFSQAATVSNDVVLAASNERVWAFTKSAAPTVEDVSLNKTLADPGDVIEVNMTITNPTNRHLKEIEIKLDKAGRFSTRIDTELAPGETKTVTAHDEAPSESGDYSVQAIVSNPAINQYYDPALNEYYGVVRETISERVPYRVVKYGIQPQFEGVIMSNLRFANDTVGVGENVTVLADLENFEGADRNLSLLAESGEFDDVRGNVTVPAGERITAEIQIETDDWATDMAVTLDGVRVGTVDVLDSRLLASMNSYDEVEPGTTVPFLVDVVNDGNEANETTIDLTIDGAVVDSRTVSLAPEEDATVELTHTFFETGTYDVSLAGAFERGFGGYESRIDIGGSADIHVNRVSDDAGAIAVGDPVSFNVSGVNDAGTAGETRLELEVEGEVVGDTTVFVDGDSTFRSVTFETSLTYTFYEPGEYNVSIDGVAHENRSVTVLEADGPVATFDVSGLDAPDQAVAGETIAVNATVSNVGDVSGDATVEITFDGEVVSTQQVSLNGSESVTASTTVPTADLDPNSYTYGVTVGNVSQSGEVIIEADDTPDGTETPGNTDTPGDTDTPDNTETTGDTDTPDNTETTGDTDTPDNTETAGDTDTLDGDNETTDDDSQGLPGFGFGIALVALFAVVVFARLRS
jgi:PGF-CTERM protein